MAKNAKATIAVECPNPAVEEQLRRMAAAYDEAALEALASRGLLRRARALLNAVAPNPQPAVRRADAVAFHVEGFDVAMPVSGPANASCGCPSVGICQHVLAVLLYLGREAAGNAATAAPQAPSPGVSTPAPEASPRKPETSTPAHLSAMNPEDIAKWAGRTAYARALTLAMGDREIIEGAWLAVRFPSLNSECRFFAGCGLDSAIYLGPEKLRRAVVAAGALAVIKAAGGTIKAPDLAASGVHCEAAGAPRSRAGVLSTAQSLLLEMAGMGLTRLPPALPGRLETLALAASSVNLPRLSLLLNRVARETQLCLQRAAQADVSRLLGATAWAYALCEALWNAGSSAPQGLIGWRRSSFTEIGALPLVGLGAYRWRSASGYEGLTALFWDSRGRRMYSWTDARPLREGVSFSAAARYNEAGPWAGALAPYQVCRCRFLLMNARVNPAGRLSSSKESHALIQGATLRVDWGDRVFISWRALEDRAAGHAPVGLAEFNPLDDVVALSPKRWGARRFEPVSQTLLWEIFDSQGQKLTLQAPHEEANALALDALERFEPEQYASTTILARLVRMREGVTAIPLCLHLETNGRWRIVNLNLDIPSLAFRVSPAPKASAKPEAPVLPMTPSPSGQLGQPRSSDPSDQSEASEGVAEAESAENEDETEREDAGAFRVFQAPSEFDWLVTEFERRLLELAEAGAASAQAGALAPSEDYAGALSAAGLPSLADAARRLTRGKEPRSRALLWACYLCGLHRQAI